MPLDLSPLHESLFVKRGLQLGDWDAVMISTDWLAQAADEQGLIDLAPFVAQTPPEGYPNAWSDSLLRLQQFDGAQLGLPYHDGPQCLIYRKDIFADPNSTIVMLSNLESRLQCRKRGTSSIASPGFLRNRRSLYTAPPLQHSPTAITPSTISACNCGPEEENCSRIPDACCSQFQKPEKRLISIANCLRIQAPCILSREPSIQSIPALRLLQDK